jgi:hypothetical protein
MARVLLAGRLARMTGLLIARVTGVLIALRLASVAGISALGVACLAGGTRHPRALGRLLRVCTASVLTTIRHRVGTRGHGVGQWSQHSARRIDPDVEIEITKLGGIS